MNVTFNSTTLRISPAKALLELQHKANHYKNIIHPRKISSQQSSRQEERRKFYSSHLESKAQKQRRQSIQRQNIRIIKDCQEIYRTKGILQKAEQQFKFAQKSPKRTLVNHFKAKQKMELLKKENKTFNQKIRKLKPLVGDKQQWKKHEAFTSDLVNKIRNKGASKVYNYETLQKIVLGSEKQKTSYLELFRTLDLSSKNNEINQQGKRKEAATARQKTRKKKKGSRKQKGSEVLNVQVQSQNEKKLSLAQTQKAENI